MSTPTTPPTLTAPQVVAYANAVGAPLTTNNTNLAVALATCGAAPVPAGGGMIVTVEPGTGAKPPEVQAIFGFVTAQFRHPYPAKALAKINQLRLQNAKIPDALYREFFDEWETGTLTPAEAKARFTSETYRSEHPNDPLSFLGEFCIARAAVQARIMGIKDSGRARVHTVERDETGREVHHFNIPSRKAA